MRGRVLLLVAALVVIAAAQPAPAAAQGRAGPGGAASVSPSVSPTPGARPGDRTRAPGFVILLVLLGLGLLWQVRRARRTTDDVAALSLDDLERSLDPDRPKDPPIA
jgi:hypothetical protein